MQALQAAQQVIQSGGYGAGGPVAQQQSLGGSPAIMNGLAQEQPQKLTYAPATPPRDGYAGNSTAPLGTPNPRYQDPGMGQDPALTTYSPAVQPRPVTGSYNVNYGTNVSSGLGGPTAPQTPQNGMGYQPAVPGAGNGNYTPPPQGPVLLGRNSTGGGRGTLAASMAPTPQTPNYTGQTAPG